MSDTNFLPPVADPFGLNGDDFGDFAAPTFVDIDGDGDLDAFVGNSGFNIEFSENTGNANNPNFATPVANPFGITSVDNFNKPTLADIDNDGDFDLFVGNIFNEIVFYENTGNVNNPNFNSPVINPFGFVGTGNRNSPAFADIDNDGDLDVFVGNGSAGNIITGFRNGDTSFYENIGDANNPSFTAPIINPFGLTSVGSDAAPTLIDIDEDGDLDAFIGNRDGDTSFYENMGDANNPNFAAAVTNPFNLATNPGLYAAPTFADIDNDGDSDLLIGSGYGSNFSGGDIQFYENIANVDPINGTDDDDAISGTRNTDIINGLGGNDSLVGRRDSDLISGNEGNDTLKGNMGNDVLDGGAGSDSLIGGNGDDILTGGNENDSLFGNAGVDNLSGGNGDDTLLGGNGNDILTGEGGNDSLVGGRDNDTLRGGVGNDTLKGGQGNDILMLAAGEGTDTIRGFQLGTDKLGLAYGLLFDNLTFSGRNILLGAETLAKLNISAENLTRSDFTTFF